MNDGDRDLRDRFTALREEEETLAPEIVDLLRRGHVRDHSKSTGRFIAALGFLAVTVVAVLWFWPTLPSFHRASVKTVVSITEWKSPTAFLLDTPGRDILQSVPTIGVGDENLPPSARQKRSRGKAQLLP